MKLFILPFLATLLVVTLGDAIGSVPRNPLPNASNWTRFNLSGHPLTIPEHVTHHPEPDLAWYKEKPEPADDVVWKRYMCKGSKLVAQISWSDFDVAQALPIPQKTVQSPYMLGE